jgi:hypothetical protein
MPKNASPDTLLKRLQKIERAQARLGDITTRIRAQADTLAELLTLAQGFAPGAASSRKASPPPGPSTAPRSAATRSAAKRSTARRKPASV